jgi:hypothetical protein
MSIHTLTNATAIAVGLSNQGNTSDLTHVVDCHSLPPTTSTFKGFSMNFGIDNHSGPLRNAQGSGKALSVRKQD